MEKQSKYPTRQELEAAVDTLQRTDAQGNENVRWEAILTLSQADPNDSETQRFIQEFKTRRGKGVSG